MKTGKWILPLALTLLALTTGMATATSIYKWVDSAGNIHYGEKPPAGVNAKKITPDTRKVGSVTPASTEPAAAEPPPAGEKTGTDQPSKRELREQRKKVCDDAREKIAKLEPTYRVMVPDENGEMRLLDAEERLGWLEEMKKIEAEFCDD